MRTVVLIAIVAVLGLSLVAFAGHRYSAWSGLDKKLNASITANAKDIDSLELVEPEVIEGTFGAADLNDTLSGTFAAGGLCVVTAVDTCNDDTSGFRVESYSTSQIVIARQSVATGAQKYNAIIVRTNNP